MTLSAINPGTGFLTECARSFWTPTTVDTYWSFYPQGDCLAVPFRTCPTIRMAISSRRAVMATGCARDHAHHEDLQPGIRVLHGVD